MGHSPVRGAMAVLCRKLEIVYDGNVQNACLPLHLLTDIINNEVMDIDEIVSKHRVLLKGLLNSRTMRNGYPTRTRMFSIMGVQGKIYLRIIDRIEEEEFVLLDR